MILKLVLLKYGVRYEMDSCSSY